MPPSPDSLTLAVDIGSSSVRAMLLDPAGQAVARTQTRYESHTTPEGGVEIDPALLSGIIFECIDRVLAERGGREIGAVAMDTLVANVFGIGDDGAPVTPIYTWADRRGSELAPQLREALDPGAYTARTGARVHTSYWPLRLMWLHDTQPDVYGRAAHWLSIGEYVLYRIFGARRVSLSAASWSGLLNRHTNDWDAETLEVVSRFIPIRRAMLSEVSDEPLSGLRGEWAARWPALRAVPWHPAIGDGVASNIGAGCTGADHIALNVGTSGAMRIVVAGRPAQVPDGLFAYCVDGTRSLVGGALSNAGNLYAWLSRTLQLPGADDLLAAVERIAPDSHKLTILPFLAGERAPGWNDRAQAVFLGMTFDTEPVHLVRAALEAIAYRFYQIARRLEPLRAEGAVYIASGAAILNSPPWMQIMADVLNAPVYANLEPEATIRGAMYMALGLNPTPRLGACYDPDAGHNAIYREAITRQEALYTRLLG